MLVSGGRVIAIDSVKVDKTTLSGDGIWEPLGVNSSAFNKAVHFTGTLSNNKIDPYFSISGNTLSANPNIKFFNLSVNYTVSTQGACPDFVYESNVAFNGINNTKYTDGIIPNQNYSFSYDILNDAANQKYNFILTKDSKLNISDVKISCIGFIGFSADPVIETINVLGDNSEAINFGDIVIRV